MLAFVDAAKGDDEVELARARRRVAETFGPEALVDAAGVIGNFERMNRIADATGIPLEAPLAAAMSDFREQLDLDAFASSANSAQLGAGTKVAGALLRKLLPLVLKLRSGRTRPER